MKRQSYLVLSFLIILLINITACSPSSDITSVEITNADVENTEVPQIAVNETPVPQPTNDELMPNSFSVYFPEELLPNTQTTQLLEDVLQTSMQESPSIRIDYRKKENSNETSIFEFLEKASLAASNAVPDLIILPNEMMPIAAAKGYIMPINQDHNTLFQDENAYPFVKQMAQVDGVYYGVPLISDLMLMVTKDNQQDLNKWADILSSGQVLRAPLADNTSLLTFLLYESLEGKIETDQSFIELDQIKLAQVLSFYYEASKNGLFPNWLNEYETYDQLWKDSVDSTDNIITWYSLYSDGYIDSFSADFVPSESGENLTYADGYVICVTNKGEEYYNEKLDIINALTEVEFIANYALALNKTPMSSISLTYWGENKNAAVVSYLAPNATVKPSNNILMEAGTVINDNLTKVLNEEIEISEALTSINEALQP